MPNIGVKRRILPSLLAGKSRAGAQQSCSHQQEMHTDSGPDVQPQSALLVLHATRMQLILCVCSCAGVESIPAVAPGLIRAGIRPLGDGCDREGEELS